MQKDFSNEFQFRTSRSSGKGGQNVNKVSTKVELMFHVDASKLLTFTEKSMIKQKLNHLISVNGFLHIMNQETRSQLQNKENTVKQFYKLLQKALHTPKKRYRTRIPKSVILKRREEKEALSAKKELRKNVVPGKMF